MGRLTADAIAEADGLSLRHQILVHLGSNHYPPVHEVFAEVCEEAVRRAEKGEWDSILTLPDGSERAVSYVVEGLHLESFISWDVTT